MEDAFDAYANLLAIRGTLAFIKGRSPERHADTVADLEKLAADLLDRIKAALQALPAEEIENLLYDLDQAYEGNASTELRALIA